MTDSFVSGQVDFGDLPAAEENPEVTVAGQRPNGHALAAKRARNQPHPALEADVSFGGRDAAHNLVAVVFDLGKAIGHGASAGAIAVGRDIKVERLVRSLPIVDVAPQIEGALRIFEVAKAP